jgi:hypothetical protein
MPEQLTQPKPAETINPNTEIYKLQKGEGVILDVSQAAYPTEVLGEELNGTLDSSRKDVVGLVGSIDPEGRPPEDNPVQFAIVKYKEDSGDNESFFIVSDFKDQDGGVKKKWTQLPKGVPLTIGRQTADSIDNYDFKDGRDLTGEEFSKGVSRSHMSIELTENGINIDNFSGNGTEVQGVKKPESLKTKDERAKVIGGGVLATSNVLIEGAPKSDEEVRQFRAADAERERAARLEANAPKIAEISQKVEDAKRRMDKAKEGLNEDDALLLWKASSAMVRYNEMKAKGRDQDARNENMLYGEARQAIANKGMLDRLTDYSLAFDSKRYSEDIIRQLEQ